MSHYPGEPVHPNSSAARIAARFIRDEQPIDPALLKNADEHHRDNLMAALRARGLQPHADASALQRVIAQASRGNPQEAADAIAEQVPDWFTRRAEPTASKLVEQLQSGATAHTRGGVH